MKCKGSIGNLQIVGLKKMCTAISTKEECTWVLSGVAVRENIVSEEEHRKVCVLL